jgi:streptogramin lyase
MSAPAPTRKKERAVPSTGPEATGASMRARVGDEIVVRGTTAGVVARDGEVVGLSHPDGSPPYDMRWAEDGRVTLHFPGSDAHIGHLPPKPHPARSSAHTSSASDELVAGDGHVPAR